MATPTISNGSTSLISQRLSTQKFDRDDCVAAIRGEKVPFGLGLALIRLCLIRGIRYHPGFAQDLHGVLPDFTRALNARTIMSNGIPDMKEEEIPYCIWHPEVASESTYRQLVQRYPQMLYHVARACAVAGYTSLYLELDVLPDVHVAEEARECGSIAIFEHIISSTVKYSVMNDYTRSIDTSNPQPANLNGDTQVRWMLNIKQEFTHADPYDEDDFSLFYHPGFEEHYFNITEDLNIADNDPPRPVPKFDVTPLLSGPLPVHLPTVDKDLLILMAAYYGDIDRYVRLRRPMMIEKELNCCVHGIYHHTMFAVWWSKQPRPKHPKIEEAVNARFIMNNVLPPINSSNLPTLIANPTIAYESTYRALAKSKPEMTPQVLGACITANYFDLFKELIANINKNHLDKFVNSQKISKPNFLEVAEQRMKELGVEVWSDTDFHRTPERNLARSTIGIPASMDVGLVGTGFSFYSNSTEDFMNGLQCDVGGVELLACLPDEWKLEPGDRRLVELDYDEWPPNWGASDASS